MEAKFEYRWYQDESHEVGHRILNTPVKRGKIQSGMIVNPTGAGKGFLVGRLTEEEEDPVLVLQPSKELLKQNFEKFEMFGGKATICSSSLSERTRGGVKYTTVNGREVRCDEISKVTFATIRSLTSRIEELKELGVKKVLIDEVHLKSKPDTLLKPFLLELGATHILGLTATPIYLNGGLEGSRIQMINRTRGSLFKTIDYVVQIKDIAEDYWSPLVYDLIKTNEGYLKLNSSGTGYTERSLRDYFENNNMYEMIKDEVKKAKGEGRKKIIVFVPTIEEAEILHKKIKGSLIVHSKMTAGLRDAMVDDFSHGKGEVIINVSVLSVGYDNSEIDCIIDASPTNSIASFYQKLGRGVRQGEKENCKIVDLAGNVGRFGKVEELLFEDDKNHGWGLFNERGDILSHYSCNIFPRPNREDKKISESAVANANRQIFYFGKFNGKTIKEVLKMKGGKGYCLWMTKEDSTFVPYGKKGAHFVDNIRTALVDHERAKNK